jgi:hypothetical protein
LHSCCWCGTSCPPLPLCKQTQRGLSQDVPKLSCWLAGKNMQQTPDSQTQRGAQQLRAAAALQAYSAGQQQGLPTAAIAAAARQAYSVAGCSTPIEHSCTVTQAWLQQQQPPGAWRPGLYSNDEMRRQASDHSCLSVPCRRGPLAARGARQLGQDAASGCRSLAGARRAWRCAGGAGGPARGGQGARLHLRQGPATR